MDLVHEKDVPFVQVCEQRRQVPSAHKRRAGRNPEAGAHFVGDDAGQRSFSQARRPREEHVVNRLISPTRRLEHDTEVLF